MEHYNPELELLADTILEYRRELIYCIDPVKGIQCNPAIKCGFTRVSVEAFVNNVLESKTAKTGEVEELNDIVDRHVCLLKIYGTLKSELEALGLA